MKIFSKNLGSSERFALNWQRLLVQGVIILSMGLMLAFASILNPNAIIMSARNFSWLPLCGMSLLGLGFLECLDAFLAKEQRDFFQNLQVGVFDGVVGGLIVISVAEDYQRLTMMIAAFLIVRGIIRAILTFVLWLPHIISMALCGLVSILSGLMVYWGWPTSAGWFIAVCLSVEIAFRGWALMVFSLWVRRQQVLAENRR